MKDTCLKVTILKEVFELSREVMTKKLEKKIKHEAISEPEIPQKGIIWFILNHSLSFWLLSTFYNWFKLIRRLMQRRIQFLCSKVATKNISKICSWKIWNLRDFFFNGKFVHWKTFLVFRSDSLYMIHKITLFAAATNAILEKRFSKLKRVKTATSSTNNIFLQMYI